MDVETKLVGRQRRFDREKEAKWREVKGAFVGNGLSVREFCRRHGMKRFVEQGYLSWDNNVAERTVKIPAIGRKNYLFVASANGGRRAAIHYSLVSSAKMNGVEPFAWLKDIFTWLPYHRGGEAFEQASSGQAVTSTELD